MSVTGFLEIERQDRAYRPVAERLRDWRECVEPAGPEQVARQAERCMGCGVPFCHTACPVNNQIPDWNELVSEQDWQAAIDRLHATNNFPEFTGRICPAPCEAACTLNLEDQPVTIKSIEQEIADRAWSEGWITPRLAPRGTGKRIAIVGSGPAGLACAQQLARMGHNATVFEKADRIGGLLRYGIPDFKMAKFLIDRRVAQMEQEGVLFRTRVEVGRDLPLDRLLDDYQAVVLAGGAEQPRDLAVPGRELPGVYFAMDYLTQQNRRVAGDPEALRPISAAGKHVVVIGGGDTGSDCVGTANRQGAASVTQLEIMPQPPNHEDKALSWPYWPLKLRTSSSHQEGCARDFAVLTEAFEGDGKVERLRCRRLDDDLAFDLPADLVLLAMGFTGTPFDGASAGLEKANGTIRAEFGCYATSRDRVFACGDMRRGQSLVVWAIREGRDCAAMVHQALVTD
jgi:glutamate synthase (NADPH) small chain